MRNIKTFHARLNRKIFALRHLLQKTILIFNFESDEVAHADLLGLIKCNAVVGGDILYCAKDEIAVIESKIRPMRQSDE